MLNGETNPDWNILSQIMIMISTGVQLFWVLRTVLILIDSASMDLTGRRIWCIGGKTFQFSRRAENTISFLNGKLIRHSDESENDPVYLGVCAVGGVFSSHGSE